MKKHKSIQSKEARKQRSASGSLAGNPHWGWPVALRSFDFIYGCGQVTGEAIQRDAFYPSSVSMNRPGIPLVAAFDETSSSSPGRECPRANLTSTGCNEDICKLWISLGIDTLGKPTAAPEEFGRSRCPSSSFATQLALPGAAANRSALCRWTASPGPTGFAAQTSCPPSKLGKNTNDKYPLT